MSDDELIKRMWRAFQAAEHVGHPDGPMNAVLAVVREHDGDAADAARYRWIKSAPWAAIRIDANPTGWAAPLYIHRENTADLDDAIDAARGKE